MSSTQNQTEAMGIEVPQNGAIGYAYDSTDVGAAFSNAIASLRTKFPGNISAVVKTIGFFAAGQPVGVAGTYVVVEKS